MQETESATFHLDHPGEEQSWAETRMLCRGWAVGRAGNLVTDLRVRLGDRIHAGVYGFPRPDLAEYFGTGKPFILAGFEAVVPLHPGSNLLEFEICDIRGVWNKVAQRTVICTAPFTAAPKPESVTMAPDFAKALRLVLQRSSTMELAASAREVSSLLDFHPFTRYAPAPFHGHLHQPTLLQRANFGRLIVEGWLFHESIRITQVAATVDLQAWTILPFGGNVPYVAGIFPQFPLASGSRFEGYIDVPSQLPQPVSLRIYAQLEDGSWHLCHVQRVCVLDGETNKTPYGRYSWGRLIRATLALRCECQMLGQKVALDRWFLRALREVQGEYRSRALRNQSLQPTSAPSQINSMAPAPRTALLCTHNLNYEGAPLFLLEFARHMSVRHGTILQIVSAADGPLRASFENLGATITIFNPATLLDASSTEEYTRALSILSLPRDAEAGLVVANTLSTFWAISLAHHAGRPSLWYIHESTTPSAFFHGHVSPGLLPIINDCFAQATHISFLTEATRCYYRGILTRSNHSLNPGWIDVSALDRYRVQHTREELRAKLGIQLDRHLVINVGAVCDRKGQHIFARAVDLLWQRDPNLAASCEFCMVGARMTPFDRVMESLVAQLDRANLHLIPETETPAEYYGAADLFVCSSYEESFPRVILEAMVFGVPIVSTAVHGIPDMARADVDAVLVPAGDSSALCDGMMRLLKDRLLARNLASQARVRVTAEYDLSSLLPRHASLAASIAEASPIKNV